MPEVDDGTAKICPMVVGVVLLVAFDHNAFVGTKVNMPRDTFALPVEVRRA